MTDWPPELQKLARILMVPLLVGLCVGIARIVQDRHGGWWQALSGIVASVLVACLVGLALQGVRFTEDETWDLALHFCFIGIASYVADDILFGLKRISAALRDDPAGFVKQLRAIWRGER